MTITPDETMRIAQLAMLKLNPSEAQVLSQELNNILNWIEQLQQVDTAGVEPLSTVVPLDLRWRDDCVTDGTIRDEVLKNAPKAEYGFFTTPKVIE